MPVPEPLPPILSPACSATCSLVPSLRHHQPHLLQLRPRRDTSAPWPPHLLPSPSRRQPVPTSTPARCACTRAPASPCRLAPATHTCPGRTSHRRAERHAASSSGPCTTPSSSAALPSLPFGYKGPRALPGPPHSISSPSVSSAKEIAELLVEPPHHRCHFCRSSELTSRPSPSRRVPGPLESFPLFSFWILSSGTPGFGLLPPLQPNRPFRRRPSFSPSQFNSRHQEHHTIIPKHPQDPPYIFLFSGNLTAQASRRCIGSPTAAHLEHPRATPLPPVSSSHHLGAHVLIFC